MTKKPISELEQVLADTAEAGHKLARFLTGEFDRLNLSPAVVIMALVDVFAGMLVAVDGEISLYEVQTGKLATDNDRIEDFVNGVRETAAAMRKRLQEEAANGSTEPQGSHRRSH